MADLVVLAHPSHGQALCLVIGWPLGISRTVVSIGVIHHAAPSALLKPPQQMRRQPAPLKASQLVELMLAALLGT